MHRLDQATLMRSGEETSVKDTCWCLSCASPATSCFLRSAPAASGCPPLLTYKKKTWVTMAYKNTHLQLWLQVYLFIDLLLISFNDNFVFSSHLTNMFLNCVRKLDNLKRSHTDKINMLTPQRKVQGPLTTVPPCGPTRNSLVCTFNVHCYDDSNTSIIIFTTILYPTGYNSCFFSC